jgi:hypothetical protein
MNTFKLISFVAVAVLSISSPHALSSEAGTKPNHDLSIQHNIALQATATSNSEFHNLEQYKAKYVNDGNRANKGHGGRFPSRGPEMIGGLWLKLEWDHDVQINGIRIFIRCNFPPYGPTEHDSWWKSGTIELSTGKKIAFTLEKTAEGQVIELSGKTARWIKFPDLMPHDDKWCAFCEVEVVGRSAGPDAGSN